VQAPSCPLETRHESNSIISSGPSAMLPPQRTHDLSRPALERERSSTRAVGDSDPSLQRNSTPPNPVCEDRGPSVMGTESGEHVLSKRYDPGRCPPMHAFFPPRPKSWRTSHATIERVPSSLVDSPPRPKPRRTSRSDPEAGAVEPGRFPLRDRSLGERPNQILRRCRRAWSIPPPRPKSRRTSQSDSKAVPSSLVDSPSATEASENVPIRS
jgi:hypothetical protein